MNDEREQGNADWLTELAGGELTEAELRAALAGRFAVGEEVDRAAAEVLTARRVRGLLLSLREAEVDVPADFEVRLLERVRADQTLLDLLELYLNGLVAALIELINALLSFLPAAPERGLAAA